MLCALLTLNVWWRSACLYENLQLPQRFQPTTYERAYTLRHNALVESHEATRTVRNMLLRNRVSRALQVAEEELGEPPDTENGESESSDDDPPVHEMQTELLEAVQLPAPAAPEGSPFSGRCFRLDDA